MIGVNSQIASSSRQSSGVGFAVPVDTVKEVVPAAAQAAARSSAPTSASPPAPIPDERRRRRRGDRAPTARRPARDLRQGDRIVAVGGTTINEPGDLSTAVLEHKPGERSS